MDSLDMLWAIIIGLVAGVAIQPLLFLMVYL